MEIIPAINTRWTSRSWKILSTLEWHDMGNLVFIAAIKSLQGPLGLPVISPG